MCSSDLWSNATVAGSMPILANPSPGQRRNVRWRWAARSRPNDDGRLPWGVHEIVDDGMRRELYSDRFRAALQGYTAIEVLERHAARAPSDHPLSLIQYLDLKTYLVGDINTVIPELKAEIASLGEKVLPGVKQTLEKRLQDAEAIVVKQAARRAFTEPASRIAPE